MFSLFNIACVTRCVHLHHFPVPILCAFIWKNTKIVWLGTSRGTVQNLLFISAFVSEIFFFSLVFRFSSVSSFPAPALEKLCFSFGYFVSRFFWVIHHLRMSFRKACGARFRFVTFCFAAFPPHSWRFDRSNCREKDGKYVENVSIRIEPAAKGEDSGRTCVSFVDVISMNSAE